MMLRLFVLVTVAALAHSLPAYLEALRFKRQAEGDIAIPSGPSFQSFKDQFPTVGAKFLDLINLYKMFSQKQTAADEPDCHLVTFGNSITDDGSSAIDDKHGFRRYTNGPIWPNYLAGDLGCKLSNRAYAGAMSGTRNYYFEEFSGQEWQLDKFLGEYPQVPENMIIGYEAAGLNDMLYAMAEEKIQDPAALMKIASGIIENNYKSLSRLLKAGASKIIVLDNWEGSAHSPQVVATGGTDGFQQILNFINGGIAEKFEKLKGEYPEAKFVLAKTAGFWDDMVAELDHAGETFTHHKETLKFGEWNEYGFYDEFHPSTVVHKMIADRAFNAWNKAT